MTVQAIVFDAYGTLFDVSSVSAACEAFWPGQSASLSALWRAKQLEYSWLRSLMGRYVSFSEITSDALRFACARLGLPCDDAQHAALMQAYQRLALFPEVPGALARLGATPLAVLSNGTPAMLDALVAGAGLSDTFAHVLSVDAVGVYKPDSRVYQLAVDRLGVPASAIVFVSSNAWDAIGAQAFGFRACWCNRLGAPLDVLGVTVSFSVSDLAAFADLYEAGFPDDPAV